MPFTKTKNSTSGDYSSSLVWHLISLRTPAYAWTASGSGTSEYYVRTAANGNPGFVATPPTTNGVYVNGTSATKGTLGSLGAGEWGYGDNDTLGYNTVYYRSAGVDPDTLAADYVQFRQIPQATENVRFPQDAGNITAGLDQSAVAIEDFIIEEGCSATLGTVTGYLRIGPNKLEDHGSGQVFIDIAGANITCIINNTASVGDGEFGHNLRGTTAAMLDYRNGRFGFCAQSGEIGGYSALVMHPDAKGVVKIGKGVTTTTSTIIHGGTVYAHATLTTTLNYGGELWLQEAAGFTTLTMWGGETHYGGSANGTTLNLRGGLFNELAGNATRTIGTVNKYRGSWTINRNKEAVTHTATTDQDSYKQSGS